MNTEHVLETLITPEELEGLAPLEPISEEKHELFQVAFASALALDSARRFIALRRSPSITTVL